MFSQLRDLEWPFVAKGMLVAFAMLTLVPAAAITVILMLFVLSPCAIIGIPFMVPALFPGANREHLEATRRSKYPVPSGAPAYAR